MVTPAKPPSQPSVQKPDNGCAIAVVIGVIVLLILAVGRCSGNRAGDNSASSAYNSANADMSNAIAAQTPPPVEPLNAASVTRGTTHLRTAVTAEGFSGAMIYSQNCYDALTRAFTWAKLDTCGAFDLLAVRSIARADTAGINSEASWFQSEAAAGRYLAAATGAGQPGAQADTRLSHLQARIARAHTAGRPVPAAANDDADGAANDSGSDDNAAIDAAFDELATGQAAPAAGSL
jgi:hypothetical protein